MEPIGRRLCLVALVLVAALLCLLSPTPVHGTEMVGTQGELALSPEVHENVWRMLADDTMVYHSSIHLPVIIEQVTYVPVRTVLPHMGCGWQSDVSSRTLSVYREEQILSFNIDTGWVLASDGREFYARTFYLNSTYYVPLRVILEEYGGRMTLLQNGDEQLARLTTGAQQLSDAEMLVLLETMPSFRPTLQERAPVNLLIRGAGGGFSRMLSALSAQGQQAAFFVTAADIGENPAHILDLFVAGHAIGIYAPNGTVQEVRDANNLLQQLLKTQTPLVLTAGYAATRELETAGYRDWNYSLSASSRVDELSASSILSLCGWRTAVFFNGSAASADQLAAILSGPVGGAKRLSAVRELTTPFRNG